MARRNESSLIEDMMKAPWWIRGYQFVGSDTKLDFMG